MHLAHFEPVRMQRVQLELENNDLPMRKNEVNTGGRNGYLRIDAKPGETIYGVKLDNQASNADGILFDHVAFRPVVQLKMSNPGVRTDGFGFTISGPSNLALVVEASTNLMNPSWASVATNTLTGSSFYFNDPAWTNFPTRFYRLRSQ